MNGLVIKNTGSWYQVKCDDGAVVSCKIKGNFRLKGIRSTNPVAVGDRVQIEGAAEGSAYITHIEDRRNWERDLLQRYLDALQRQFDVLGRTARAPTFDEAWLSYRQQNIYGLFFWITNTEEQQPRENNLALALRYAMATLDHGTLQLLS